MSRSPSFSAKSRAPLAGLAALVAGLLTWHPAAPGLPTRGPLMDVVRPRLGTPAILQPGRPFVVEFAPTLLGAPTSLVATLEDDAGHEHTLDLEPAAGSAFHALTSEELPHGRYTLHLATERESISLAGAVFVRGPLGDRWSVIHMADLPRFDGRGESAGMDQIVREVNAIAPDLVLATGDLAYGGSDAQWSGLARALLAIDAPVIATPGNHAREGFAGYVRTLRNPRSVVEFGAVSIVSLDSVHGMDALTATQREWLQASIPRDAERVTLLQLHHPLFGPRSLGTGTEWLANLCVERGVDVVLAGHRHADRVQDHEGQDVDAGANSLPSPLFTVVTGGGAEPHPEVGTSDVVHGYRWLRFEGQELVQLTEDRDGDGRPEPSASVERGWLELELIQAEGRQARWVATSSLGTALEGALLRVPATPLADRAAPAPQVAVRVDLPARGTVEFEVTSEEAP